MAPGRREANRRSVFDPDGDGSASVFTVPPAPGPPRFRTPGLRPGHHPAGLNEQARPNRRARPTGSRGQAARGPPTAHQGGHRPTGRGARRADLATARQLPPPGGSARTRPRARAPRVAARHRRLRASRATRGGHGGQAVDGDGHGRAAARRPGLRAGGAGWRPARPAPRRRQYGRQGYGPRRPAPLALAARRQARATGLRRRRAAGLRRRRAGRLRARRRGYGGQRTTGGGPGARAGPVGVRPTAGLWRGPPGGAAAARPPEPAGQRPRGGGGGSGFPLGFGRCSPSPGWPRSWWQ